MSYIILISTLLEHVYSTQFNIFKLFQPDSLTTNILARLKPVPLSPLTFRDRGEGGVGLGAILLFSYELKIRSRS
jgi:hypothetical protein